MERKESEPRGPSSVTAPGPYSKGRPGVPRRVPPVTGPGPEFPIEGEGRGMNEEEIIDGLKTICLCKGIPKKTFRRQIAAGARTVAELKQATGAGSGNCQGRRCTPRIEELLRDEADPAGEP